MAKAKNEDEISRLREMFDQLDINNTGMLTISEIRKAFHKLGYVLPEKEFKKIWKGLDFHDEGTINYTEFLAATINSFHFGKEEEIWSAFKYFEGNEADNDGVISVESLLKAIKGYNISVNEKEIRKSFNELENKGKVLNFEVFKELITSNAK